MNLGDSPMLFVYLLKHIDGDAHHINIISSIHHRECRVSGVGSVVGCRLVGSPAKNLLLQICRERASDITESVRRRVCSEFYYYIMHAQPQLHTYRQKVAKSVTFLQTE
jgi:hypothetical protein